MNIENLPIDLIDPDRNQPRSYFDEEALIDLASNIKELGLLSPIKVTKQDERYKIIFGNRRYLACKSLGFEFIPAIVSGQLTEEEIYLEQVAENVQRENFSPLEEAEAYKKLLSFGKENLGITQLSHRFGKSVSYINKKVSLLEFNDEIKQLIHSGKDIKEGKLTEEQVLPLLNVPIHYRTHLAKKIAIEGSTVSDAKKISELFTSNEEDISTNVKNAFLKKSVNELINEYNEFQIYLNKKEDEKKKKVNLRAVGNNYIVDPKSETITFNLPLPVHKQLQKLFVNLSNQQINGKTLREINSMKVEEREEFLTTVNHFINSLEYHLNQWTKVRNDLKKANIKLVKE